MTDDHGHPDDPRTDEQGGRQTDTADNPGSRDTATDWDEISSDPDAEDLGYERSQWEQIPGPDDTKIVLLPTDEALLHEQAFIVLDENSICDLMRHR